MPNYCSCKLEINGPEDQVNAFFEKAGEDFDFNNFIPLPEDLRGIVAGSTTVNGERVNCYRRRSKETGEIVEDFNFNRDEAEIEVIPEERQKELIAKYGAINWYDWNIKNWGTKWGACDSRVERSENAIYFDTAWSPPIEFVESISPDFPDCEFQLHYAEMGLGFLGTTIFKDDLFYETVQFNGSFYKEPENEDDLGDYELTEEVEAFITEHGIGVGG